MQLEGMPAFRCSRLCSAPGTSPMESTRDTGAGAAGTGLPTERALTGRADVVLRPGVGQESVAEAGLLGPALALACMRLQ